MLTTIKANFRKNQKTQAVRRLRKQNKCPAIIYQNTQHPTLPIELYHNDIHHPKIIHQFFKDNIIKLIINEKTTITVTIQEIQYHPFKLKIIHIDFIHIL